MRHFDAGDKQHVGLLKSLITEASIAIEGKFQKTTMGRNYLHIMLELNERWVIPAALGSRRYCVLEVSAAKVNDYAYFGAIQKELDDGGHATMLHELLKRDISNSNLREVPVTDALTEQRTLSLGTTEQWVDCLHRGYVWASKLGLEDMFGVWMDTIRTHLLFASYQEFCKGRRYDRHPLRPRELWQVAAGQGWLSTDPTRG